MHDWTLPEEVIARVRRIRGRQHMFDDIVPAATALVVIDMQNAFMAEGAPGETPLARAIVPNVNRLAEAARTSGATVVWVRVGTLSARGEWAMFLDHFCHRERRAALLESLRPGSAGHALWPGLDVRPGDLHVEKDRFSAFLPDACPLGGMLRARGIDTVIIAGTVTNVCCEASARDAMMMDFKTIVVADANAARTDAEHRASLVSIVQVVGDVRPTDEIVERLATAAQAAE